MNPANWFHRSSILGQISITSCLPSLLLYIFICFDFQPSIYIPHSISLLLISIVLQFISILLVFIHFLTLAYIYIPLIFIHFITLVYVYITLSIHHSIHLYPFSIHLYFPSSHFYHLVFICIHLVSIFTPALQVLLISHLKIIINLMFRFNKHVLYLIELATPLSKSNRVNESYV